ncbi:MAG TPA: hypothetical protein VGE41_09190 [Verrucomicrobiae bacterium]
MFDFDQAIEKWRRSMEEKGVRGAEILDELESHLRDGVEEQLQSGTDLEQAFALEVQRIGDASKLKLEYKKSVTMGEQIKVGALIFAGITSNDGANIMNMTQTEPRWATYLRSAAFLGPVIVLWAICALFVVPKLQYLLQQANIAGERNFWKLTHANILTVNYFREYGWMLASLIACALATLEWRFRTWPRYRRATLGLLTFAMNLLVLLSIFMMILTAVVAAAARS